MTVFAGDVIYASDINKLAPQTYTKTTVTSRLSTTTMAADPELQGISLAVGTYEIELLLFYTVASTSPKLKTRWIFSGSWNSPVRGCIGPGNVTTPVNNPEAFTEMNARGYPADTSDAVYNSTTSSAFSVAREVARNVVVSTVGTVALHWAQNVSTASNVNVQPGSTFTVRRIS